MSGSDARIRADLEHHWQACDADDQDAAHEIYADDRRFRSRIEMARYYFGQG